MAGSSASSELKFYFDESVELAVSEQLAAGGLDVVSAHSLDLLGDEDRNHLERATAMGRVLCTYDADFLRLAGEGMEHAGIIYAQQQKASIGGWVREIRAIYARLQAEDIAGQVVFLSMR
jgi:hypothetical protein